MFSSYLTHLGSFDVIIVFLGLSVAFATGTLFFIPTVAGGILGGIVGFKALRIASAVIVTEKLDSNRERIGPTSPWDSEQRAAVAALIGQLYLASNKWDSKKEAPADQKLSKLILHELRAAAKVEGTSTAHD